MKPDTNLGGITTTQTEEITRTKNLTQVINLE